MKKGGSSGKTHLHKISVSQKSALMKKYEICLVLFTPPVSEFLLQIRATKMWLNISSNSSEHRSQTQLNPTDCLKGPNPGFSYIKSVKTARGR